MRAVIVGLSIAIAACGTEPPPDDQPPPEVFIAFATSFADFRDWTFFHSDGPAPGTQPPEVLGPRSQYISAPPPPGSTEFPVGTMIVEVRESPGNEHILAGVKRGGGFNDGRNWEWFELVESPVVIVWRGVGPPNGETYGGDPDGGCNSCHAACGAANDYVCSSFLQLGSF